MHAAVLARKVGAAIVASRRLDRRRAPHLVEPAKKALQGRRRHPVFTVLFEVGFMKGWSVDARYKANGYVDATKYQKWRKDASRTLGAANLRRRPK